MSQTNQSNPLRYGSRYPSSGPTQVACACLVCDAPLSSSRATYCSAACKQLAFRLRRRRRTTPDLSIVRMQLKRQRLLVAYTIYECPSCQERFLGEQRCPSCQLFCRALGVGGQCPECDHAILLTELIEENWATT
jgi:hypothetical protein